MRIFKAKSALFFTVTLLCMSIAPAMAQVPMQKQQSQQQTAPDISDAELKSFVTITQDVMKVRQSYQQKMVSAIQDKGLSPQEFQKMAQNQQSGKQSDMSEEKQKKFSNAMSAVMSIQKNMNEEVKTVVQDHDMEMQQYQQMSMQIQQSPKLSKKVNKMMQQGQQGQPQPQQP